MPAVKNVGEPCAGEPHARIDAAAGGNQTSRASTCRAVQAPLADPTKSLCGSMQTAAPEWIRRGRLAEWFALVERAIGVSQPVRMASVSRL
jgi:hypothetical protein